MKHQSPTDYIHHPTDTIWQYAHKRRNLRQSVIAHCNECNAVKVWTAESDCTSKQCWLYPYRPGNGPCHYPKRVRNISEAERKRLIAGSKRLGSHRKAKG